MASQAPTDLDVMESNTNVRNLGTRKGYVKDLYSQTTNFAIWCLFGNKEPSSGSLAVEQPLPLPSTPCLTTSTAFLTGLRGIAALFVYHFHLVTDSFPNSVDPFVSWHASSFFQLPVIRIVYAGGQMVALFFLISGFVLSIKPIRLARQGKWAEFSKSLTSSVFRRGLRLFLPCVPSTLLVMLATQLHLFPDNAKMAPKIQDSLWAQLLDWISFFFRFVMNIWSFEPQHLESNYGAHLWTIPFEFRDSMILFVSVTGTAALRPGLFSALNVASAIFCLMYGKWDVSLFFVGIFMAGSFDRPMLVSLRKEIKATLTMVALFVGVYLSSLPTGDGSIWLSSSGQVGTGIGLVVMMGSFLRNRSLQQFLSSKPIQYLGDVSFSLYIIHEPILILIGWRMVPWIAEKFGGSLPLGLVCTWMLLTPPLFFLASLYSRYIEKPSLALARSLESLCFVDSGSKQDGETELLVVIND